jgi:septum formation protein
VSADVPRVVLASASPRRSALLTTAGLRFEVDPAHVDEDVAAGTLPVAAARELALRKARCVAERNAPPALVLGADTIVALPRAEGFELLGKPSDAADAARMLGLLSGSRHLVVTGVAVVAAGSLAALVEHEETWVTMRPLAASEIEAYVAGGEWRDKAGGYAIQGIAGAFVVKLQGSYTAVVGLPLYETAGLLAGEGYPVHFNWLNQATLSSV